MKMTIGRKGASIDLLYIMVMALVIGISTLVALYVHDQSYTLLSPMLDNAEAQNVMNTSTASLRVLDYLFVTTYFMSCLGSIISAALVRNHPIFLVVSIILMMVVMIISPIISNVMLEFWSQPEFAEFAEGGGGTITLPLMTRVFQYMPHITAVLSVMIMILSFSKGDEALGV